jgi:hypothetical protein
MNDPRTFSRECLPGVPLLSVAMEELQKECESMAAAGGSTMTCEIGDIRRLLAKLREQTPPRSYTELLHDRDLLAKANEELKAELQGKNHTRLDQLEADYARQQTALNLLQKLVSEL